MKVINIFLIISIFAFVNVAHAMATDEEYPLDFSQRSKSFIRGLISEEIVRPGERKTLRLTNIVPKKFELLKNVLCELIDRGATRKIIYSYDESLTEMPELVDVMMSFLSSKKRIIIKKEGIKQWPEEQAPEFAKLYNKDAEDYYKSEDISDETEFMHSFHKHVSKEQRDQEREDDIDSMGYSSVAIKEGYGDDGHSDVSDY